MRTLLTFLLIFCICDVDAEIKRNFINTVGSALTAGVEKVGSAAGKVSTGLAKGIDKTNKTALQTSNQINTVKKSAKKVKQDTYSQFTQSLYGEMDDDDDEYEDTTLYDEDIDDEDDDEYEYDDE